MACLDTGTTLDLPPELWYKIFKDFRKDTLFNISLICRYLHNIAQPFIFRDLHLSQENSLRLSHNLARLDFYGSDVIAPHVRELSISISHDMQRQDYLNFIFSLFNLLPRFLNT